MATLAEVKQQILDRIVEASPLDAQTLASTYNTLSQAEWAEQQLMEQRSED